MRRCPLGYALFLPCLLLVCPAADAATGTSTFTALYGKTCQTVDPGPQTGSRLCRGPAGYALLVYDSAARASVDIVAPDNALFPLSYWDVVTPGLSALGQQAEWLMARRQGKTVPAALLVRLTRPDVHQAPLLIAAARIQADGACVVFRAELDDPAAEARARRAALDPASKCLGPLGADEPS